MRANHGDNVARRGIDKYSAMDDVEESNPRRDGDDRGDRLSRSIGEYDGLLSTPNLSRLSTNRVRYLEKYSTPSSIFWLVTRPVLWDKGSSNERQRIFGFPEIRPKYKCCSSTAINRD